MKKTRYRNIEIIEIDVDDIETNVLYVRKYRTRRIKSVSGNSLYF